MDSQSLAHPAQPDPSEEQRELRECRSCYGSGAVVEDAAYDFETGELVQAVADCPICGGAGSVSVYRYARDR